jgi:fluoroquinolone resistance protein
MNLPYFTDQILEKKDFAQKPLPKGEYENCVFINCNFSSTDISEFTFSACEFKGCNLSLAKLNKTAMREIKFNDCKLTGLQFQTCNDFLFSVQFENCILNLSSFYKLKIKRTLFKSSSLHEVDFAEADLSMSIFENCDLSRAIFESSTIEKCDFCTSYNYSINPEENNIKKAKFSLVGVIGLLEKYDIEIA